MTKAHYAVFIGRFQPFHNGHAAVIKKGLELAERVIVLIGSANSSRSLRNPFTYKERAQVIDTWAENNAPHEPLYGRNKRVIVAPLDDYTYRDNEWISAVHHTVNGVKAVDGWRDKTVIKLIGHSKDHTSYYLSLFPVWGNIDVDAYTERHLINSTEIRNLYFTTSKDAPLADETMREALYQEVIPLETLSFLQDFTKNRYDEWKALADEKEFSHQYKKDHQFAGGNISYLPIHTTVDAIVVQSGHVLLVRRKTFPGKGQWAIPGGFLGQFEYISDAIVRELREETKIKVPPAILKSNMTKREVFEDPHRSSRGRVITHAGLIELPPDTTLPKVKGSDDADKAKWVPINELNPKEFYEDHYHIIKKMLGDR